MKLAKKLLAIVLAVLLMMPTVLASAESTKADEIVDMLNESELLGSLGGTATYEDDTIWIEYMSDDATSMSLSYPFDGTVIECTTDSIIDLDSVIDASTRFAYMIYLLYTALELNGYTEDEIMEYFLSEDADPSMEVNGFEIEMLGDWEETNWDEMNLDEINWDEINWDEISFDDENDFSALISMSIKVDVAKANLNGPDDEPFEPTETTVQDVVDTLAADEEFTTVMWDEDTVFCENSIYLDDDAVIIDHTDYTSQYHSFWFNCEDDVLTYEPYMVLDFSEAEYASEEEMWLMTILQYALKANGYSAEEIAAYLDSEDNHPTMEVNGFEIKPGYTEAFTFEGDYTLTIMPLYVTIDLAKANLNAPESEAESEEEVSEQEAGKTDIENSGSNETTPSEETESSAASTAPVTSPDTGDTTVTLAIALLFMSLIAVAATMIKSKKTAE